MAFGELNMKDLRMELKVCEGCGALWLRASLGFGAGIYCRNCAAVMAEFPAAKGPKKVTPTRVRRALACVGGAR